MFRVKGLGFGVRGLEFRARSFFEGPFSVCRMENALKLVRLYNKKCGPSYWVAVRNQLV